MFTRAFIWHVVLGTTVIITISVSWTLGGLALALYGSIMYDLGKRSQESPIQHLPSHPGDASADQVRTSNVVRTVRDGAHVKENRNNSIG